MCCAWVLSLLAAVGLGERIQRGVEGPHFISLVRLTARGGFATIVPAIVFDALKITTTSVAREGMLIPALVVVQIALLAARDTPCRPSRAEASGLRT